MKNTKDNNYYDWNNYLKKPFNNPYLKYLTHTLTWKEVSLYITLMNCYTFQTSIYLTICFKDPASVRLYSFIDLWISVSVWEKQQQQTDRLCLSVWDCVSSQHRRADKHPAYQEGRNQPLPPHCVMLPKVLPWHLALSVPPFLFSVWLALVFLPHHSCLHSSITIKVQLLIVLWCLWFRCILCATGFVILGMVKPVGPPS